MKKSILLTILISVIIHFQIYSQAHYSQYHVFGGENRVNFQELSSVDSSIMEPAYYPIKTMWGEDSLDSFGDLVFYRDTSVDIRFILKNTEKLHTWFFSELYTGIAFLEYPNGQLQYEGYFSLGKPMYGYHRCWDIRGNPIWCSSMSSPSFSLEPTVSIMQLYPLKEVQLIPTYNGIDTFMVMTENGGDSVDVNGNVVLHFEEKFEDLAYYNGEKITGVVFEIFFNNLVKSSYYFVNGRFQEYREYYFTGEVKKTCFGDLEGSFDIPNQNLYNGEPNSPTAGSNKFHTIDEVWTTEVSCFDKQGNEIECE